MASRYRVYVTDQVFPDLGIERGILAQIGATLTVASGDRDAVLTQVADADALLNTYLPLDARAISRLQHCRVIARYGIGTDNVDVEAARAGGIVVTNVPDYCVEEVAAHALSLLLALLRRVPEADALVRGGGWGVQSLRPIQRLSEVSVGLVGYGRISRRLAEMLRPLGVRLLVHDPYVDRESAPGVDLVGLEDLLAGSDAVSLHCPLTEETRGLIGAEQLARMREDAILVNTSRGPLVVLGDLLAALRGGTIRGAGLDVFPEEPPDAALFEGVPGLLLTPHVAYYSEAAIRESERKAATQIVKVLSGQPPDYPVAMPEGRR